MAIKYILIGLLISMTTATGNYILKLGAAKPGWFGPNLPPVNLYFLGGGALFGLSLLIYMILLKDLPLFVAQSLISIQYIAVMVIARLVLDEKMSWSDIAGMAFIVCGILLIAQRNHAPA